MHDDRREPGTDSERRRHALLAGGGSAGHVFPGLAVAEILLARGWNVTWAGRAEGMERSLVERRGLDFAPLPASPLVGQGLVGKARALLTLLASAWRGRRLIDRLGAQVVVGTGGYASAPAILGARVGRRPTLLIEPNARAGTANRFLSRWASLAAVAFGEAGDDLHCPVEVTGTPVRASFFRRPDRAASERREILVVGGSQGARELNEAMPEALERLADGAPVRVLHQAGAGHGESVRAAYRRRRVARIEVEVVEFVEEMPDALGGCDLVVSRAGAITLAEICAAGRASILVPLRLAGGHQADNARRLERAGAAVVAEGEALADRLAEALRRLLADPARLAAMGRAARSLAVEDAAARIADLVESLEEAA